MAGDVSRTDIDARDVGPGDGVDVTITGIKFTAQQTWRFARRRAVSGGLCRAHHTTRRAALQLELIMLAPIIQKLNRNELVPFVGDERLTFGRTPHEAQVTVQVRVPA
jgi:hypothetical protein